MMKSVTPTVIQMEAAECGAAALSIILGYYGKHVPLEELRYRCGVSRDGCDAYNLLEAAKYYGLETNGYGASLEEIKQIKTPFIVYWQYNHFVVVEGFRKKFVSINDPATGPRTISYEEFNKNYSQVALTAYPSKSFKKGGIQPSFINLLKKRWQFFKPSFFFLLISLQCILILLGLAFPALSRIFIDNIMTEKMLSWSGFFISFMILVIFLQAIAAILKGNLVNRITRQLSIVFSVDFLWHVLKLPLLFFTQRFGGEIINRMSLNIGVAEFLTSGLTVSLISTGLILIYAIIMFQYDVVIASIGIGGAILNMALFQFILRKRSNAYSRLQQDLAKSIGISIDTLQNMEFTKATSTEPFSFARIMGLQVKNLNNFQTIGKKDIWLRSLSAFLVQLAAILVLGFGAWRVMNGHLSVGMLLALQMLMAAFFAPFSQMINSGMQIQTLKIDMQRLDDVLQNRIDSLFLKSVTAGKKEEEKLKGDISLEKITFGYSPLDDPLIKDLSLSVKAGQKIALVGKTGSGKSTLAKLFSGLFKPWSGQILFDGIPLENLSRNQFVKLVSFVDQEIMLFSGTVRENLTLWNKEISDSELEQATTDAQIDEVIKSRDESYDSKLIEKGSNFSQGERQRLEIARALVTNPKILILDEALSGVDSETELAVMNNITKRGCTCIIISHRLSTIKNCEKIYVLDHGRLMQEGTHDELKSTEGIYQELVKLTEANHL